MCKKEKFESCRYGFIGVIQKDYGTTNENGTAIVRVKVKVNFLSKMAYKRKFREWEFAIKIKRKELFW